MTGTLTYRTGLLVSSNMSEKTNEPLHTRVMTTVLVYKPFVTIYYECDVE